MSERLLLSMRLGNLLHSALLLGAMALLLALVGWTVLGPHGVTWAVLLGIGLLLLSPRVPVGVLTRMIGARRLEAYEAPALFELRDSIARRAALTSPPALYWLPRAEPTALTLGRREDAAVVLSEGLLRSLGPRELAGVLAHELSHVRHNDLWLMTMAGAAGRLTRGLSLVATILILLALPSLAQGGASVSLLPLLLVVLAPTLSALLQLALSRSREYAADLRAAALTGDPRGLASALTKLEAGQRRGLARLLPLSWTAGPELLRTHPHTAERVRRLLSLEQAPAYV